MRVDPVNFELVENALAGVAKPMAATIRRNLMFSTGD